MRDKPKPTDFISIRPGVLTSSECDDIVKYFEKETKFEEAKIYLPHKSVESGERHKKGKGRSGTIAWDKNFSCPHYGKFLQQITDFNLKWGYNLSGHFDLQFARYDVGDYFNRHADTYMDLGHFHAAYRKQSTRKISASIQLSDDNEYEGCNLRVFYDKNEKGSSAIGFSRKKGDMVIFPSFIPHEITPVEKGQRNALVIWAHGPDWK